MIRSLIPIGADGPCRHAPEPIAAPEQDQVFATGERLHGLLIDSSVLGDKGLDSDIALLPKLCVKVSTGSD